jgi:chromate transporter
MNLTYALLTGSDWLGLFLHYLGLSLLTIGGAMVTAPEMHRYLVQENGWLTDAQFTASIALAQAAPGPNILFVALLGWHVGINADSMQAALLGAGLAMAGMLLPSTVVAYVAGRWAHRNRHLRAVRAFKLGLGPVVISLIMATGWIMASAYDEVARDWKLWGVMLLSVGLVLSTRLHLLWLLAAGAGLGAMGWV